VENGNLAFQVGMWLISYSFIALCVCALQKYVFLMKLIGTIQIAVSTYKMVNT